MTVRWRLLGGGAEEAGGPLLRSSTDCSRGLVLSELGAPLSVLSMSYLRVRVGLEANTAGILKRGVGGSKGRDRPAGETSGQEGAVFLALCWV